MECVKSRRDRLTGNTKRFWKFSQSKCDNGEKVESKSPRKKQK